MADQLPAGFVPDAPEAQGGDDELAFLKPGFKRPSPAGFVPDDETPAGPPDKIGAANQAYRENLAAMSGMTNAAPGDSSLPGASAGAPIGRIPTSKAMSALGGFNQGASFGFADELAGLGSATVDTFTGGMPGTTFGERYRRARDDARRAYAEAQEDNPKTYFAGELAGGLATSAVPGAAAEGLVGKNAARLAELEKGAEGATGAIKLGAKAAALKAAKAGAAQGFVQGLGSSEADLTQGDWKRAFTDASKAGATGALIGGALGGIGGKIAQRAEKNAKGWVVSDIQGEIKGASTPTARKQLADDADDAARLLRQDKELDKAINNARHGSVDDLKAAQDLLDQRLQQTGSKLEPKWEEIKAAMPRQMKAGDLTDHLESKIQILRDTGHTSDSAEADALQGIVDRIKNAREWGGKTPTFDASKPVTGMGEQIDGMKSGDAIKLLGKLREANPGAAKQIQAQIQQIKDAATTVGFDPNRVIHPRQMQKLWSDEAGIAYKSMGGINGTPTFERKLDVASHLREVRDAILQDAGETNPKAVAETKAINSDYSALKRMKEVIDQRTNRAVANDTGNGMGHIGAWLTSFGRKHISHGGVSGAGMALATGHPHVALGLAAGAGVVAGKRALDRGTANLIEKSGSSGLARAMLSLMQAGVPQATAARVAQQAVNGGVVDEAYRGLLGTIGLDETAPETP